MISRLLLLSFTCLALLGEPAHAYIVAVPADQPPLDHSRPTHILIPGRGTNLALQPQLAALTRGELYQKNFVGDQVVMISVLEHKDNERFLNRAGWKLIVKNNVILETGSVLAEVEKFTQIRSFEMFGHSSALRGFQMDGDYKTSIRFDPREERVWDLRDNFAPGAYAILYGCNTGWRIAQVLAEKWQIAVAGTFTETQFERLHSNGQYYVEGKQFAPSLRWADTNSELENRDCDLGGCTRMRPNNLSYAGWWGNFAGPLLTHFKFFCPLKVQDCQMRMAASLYAYAAEKPLSPDSDYEHFKDVAKQFLCPLSKDRKITEDCYKQLGLIDQGKGNHYVHFVGGGNQQLVCDLRGCKANIDCNLDDKVHKCKISDRVWVNSTTLVDEYMHLLNGYRMLFVQKNQMK